MKLTDLKCNQRAVVRSVCCCKESQCIDKECCIQAKCMLKNVGVCAGQEFTLDKVSMFASSYRITWDNFTVMISKNEAHGIDISLLDCPENCPVSEAA